MNEEFTSKFDSLSSEDKKIFKRRYPFQQISDLDKLKAIEYIENIKIFRKVIEDNINISVFLQSDLEKFDDPYCIKDSRKFVRNYSGNSNFKTNVFFFQEFMNLLEYPEAKEKIEKLMINRLKIIRIE